MKIGIIGSGQVGQTLAKAFKSEGNEVMLGTRNTLKEEVVKFKNENDKIKIGTFEQTASYGEIIVLAVAGAAASEAVKLGGINNFDNKIVIDTTNPIANEPPVNGVLKFFTDLNESLMERIQNLIANAKVVKAFNSVGNTLMYKPSLKEKPTMFICGNDDEARKTVSKILENFGWEVADMGKAEAARAIEPLSILWCIRGFINNKWNHAFKLLKD
ncbi:MAG: NADPH-dependent F420 reductase [Chitinophagaceae bacterium]